jgi:large subunit ribosomal protein LP2
MKVIAAYLLAVLGGKKEPTADNVNAILASVGSKAEADDVNGLIAALKGKTLQEVIDAGMKNVGGGGGMLLV